MRNGEAGRKVEQRNFGQHSEEDIRGAPAPERKHLHQENDSNAVFLGEFQPKFCPFRYRPKILHDSLPAAISVKQKPGARCHKAYPVRH